MVPQRGIRVIAGTAGRRVLLTPVGDTTRPMTGRAREAVFSALDSRDRIRSTAVLDLYAGSGSLAIESLSRGASCALLVESDADATTAARANLASTGFDGVARVLEADVPTSVAGEPRDGAPFGLVFLDPPYALDDEGLRVVLARVVTSGWIDHDGLVVVHRRAEAPPVPSGWCITWQRTFGDTLLAFVQPADRSSASSTGTRS